MAIKFDIKKILTVPIEEVRANGWNPKEKNTVEYEKIRDGIKSKGQRMPIVVRQLVDSKGYEILDGEQRWTACKELGFDKILIYSEGVVSDQEAKELTIWYQQQVPFSEVDLASLVTEMVEEYGTVDLPYSEVELQHFAELVNFDMSDYSNEKPDEDDDIKSIKVTVTEGQFKVIRKAIDRVVINDNCSEGQALERICIEFLGSPLGTTGLDQE